MAVSATSYRAGSTISVDSPSQTCLCVVEFHAVYWYIRVSCMCVSTPFHMKHYERLKVCHVLGLTHSGWSTLTDIHVCTVQLQLLCPSLSFSFLSSLLLPSPQSETSKRSMLKSLKKNVSSHLIIVCYYTCKCTCTGQTTNPHAVFS